MTVATLGAGAQQKQFTLEDLNFGGKNYKQMSPKSLRLWWDGNTLVNSDTLVKLKGYPQVSRVNIIYMCRHLSAASRSRLPLTAAVSLSTVRQSTGMSSE